MSCSNDNFPAHAARRAAAVIVAFAAVLVAGCGPLAVVNVLSPSGHYTRVADQAYGEAPRQKLDLYRPSEASSDASEEAPVVVFFYGNGWRKASKNDFEFVAASLTEAGMVVVIPDYRAYPEVAFPTFVEDGARAVAWATRNLDGLAEGERPLFLMGHSAGAQIAALLALDGQYLDAVESPPLAGFIGLSGPYDFLPLEPGYMQEVFPEDTRPASQPINFVSADAPPTLLIHGTGDERVLPEHSERLAEALEAEGVPVTLKFYEDVGHARVVVALAPPLQFIADTMPDTIAFIESD